MFGIWVYHLLYGFLGLPRYEKMYLNMPLNTPTHHSVLPISETLQAAIKLKWRLTLITKVNCDIGRRRTLGRAVLVCKHRSWHAATSHLMEEQQNRQGFNGITSKTSAVCRHSKFTTSLSHMNTAHPLTSLQVSTCCTVVLQTQLTFPGSLHCMCNRKAWSLLLGMQDFHSVFGQKGIHTSIWNKKGLKL